MGFSSISVFYIYFFLQIIPPDAKTFLENNKMINIIFNYIFGFTFQFHSQSNFLYTKKQIKTYEINKMTMDDMISIFYKMSQSVSQHLQLYQSHRCSLQLISFRRHPQQEVRIIQKLTNRERKKKKKEKKKKNSLPFFERGPNTFYFIASKLSLRNVSCIELQLQHN